MTTFDERERAFERRFAQEEEHRFHARNRRHRLLAIWASERMTLAGQAAEGYVTSFTECAVVTDDDTLVERLRSDLRTAGIEATPASLRGEMERCAMLARYERRFADAPNQGSTV